uniref:Putative kazal-type inhibitor n=1 Tax=Panstrongylus megistus TaxID=65343 RepID=A0A069DNH2_9HEMI
MKVLILCLLIIGLQMINLAESKCKCDCRIYPIKPVCGKDVKTGDEETFPNVCHLQCYNCTHNKSYIVIHTGDC